jgi:hypothetical protein
VAGGALRKWTLPFAALAPGLRADRLFRGPVDSMVTYAVPKSHLCIVALQDHSEPVQGPRLRLQPDEETVVQVIL